VLVFWLGITHHDFLHTTLNTALSQELLMIRSGVMPHPLRRYSLSSGTLAPPVARQAVIPPTNARASWE